jgi:WD40 repeat protein
MRYLFFSLLYFTSVAVAMEKLIPYQGPNVQGSISTLLYSDDEKKVIAANFYASEIQMYESASPFKCVASTKSAGFPPFWNSSLSKNNTGQLVFPDGKEVAVLDLATWEKIASLQGHTQDVDAVSFNPVNPNQVASGSDDKTLKLWDLRQKVCTKTVETEDYVAPVEFSPDGKQVTTGNILKPAKVFDVATAKELDYKLAAAVCLAYNKTGSQLAVGSSLLVRIYDPATGKLIKTISTRGKIIAPGQEEVADQAPTAQCIAYSADGSQLMIGTDGVVTIASLNDKISPYFIPAESALSGQFNKNATQLVTGTQYLENGGTTIRIWDLPQKANGGYCSLQ